MRNTPTEWSRILPGMCKRAGLEMKDVREKTKYLLKTRREMAWMAPEYPDGEGYVYESKIGDIHEALSWMKGYYCSENTENDDQNLMILWETGLMKKPMV